MEFRDALDALGLDSASAGELFNLQPQTIRQMRLEPGTAGYREPPAGWQGKLADEARKRGGELAAMEKKLRKAR